MAHDYPRFGGDRKLEHTEAGCECCDKPATHIVDVQVSWFRGEDECYHVCSYHVGMIRKYDGFKKFMRHYETKQKGA